MCISPWVLLEEVLGASRRGNFSFPCKGGMFFQSKSTSGPPLILCPSTFLTFALQLELAYINTSHPDFIGGSRAIAEVMERNRTPNGGSSGTEARQASAWRITAKPCSMRWCTGGLTPRQRKVKNKHKLTASYQDRRASHAGSVARMQYFLPLVSLTNANPTDVYAPQPNTQNGPR